MLDQLLTEGRTTYEAVALLIGADQPGPAFNCACSDCPPLPSGWTIGQAAEHYLACQLERLRSFNTKKVA